MEQQESGGGVRFINPFFHSKKACRGGMGALARGRGRGDNVLSCCNTYVLYMYVMYLQFTYMHINQQYAISDQF